MFCCLKKPVVAYLLLARVTGRPLCQPPLLYNPVRWLKRHELSGDISIENGKLGTRLSPFEESRWCACEGCDPLRVCKRLVHLFGCGPKFVRGGDGGGVNRGVSCGRSSCGRRYWGGYSFFLWMPRWGGDTTRRIRSWSVLQIFSMFLYKCWAKFLKCCTKLRGNLRANKVFDRLFLLRLRVDVYIEL